MADNGNSLGAPTEQTNERVHAPQQYDRSKVGVNTEAYGDEINQNLLGINTKVELMSFGSVGNATAGNNQQPNETAMAEELAPRTTTNEGNASAAPESAMSAAAARRATLSEAAAPESAMSAAAAPGATAPPKQGVDDVYEKPEGDGKVDASMASGGTASGSTPTDDGDTSGDAAAAKSEAAMADNAKKQGASMAASGGANEKPPENKMAANSSIVSQIMGEYQKVKSQSTDSNNGTTLKGTQSKEDEKVVQDELARTRNTSTQPTPTDAPTDQNPTSDSTDKRVTGDQSSSSTSESEDDNESAERAAEEAKANAMFNSDLSTAEQKQLDEGKAQKQAASKEGVDVGRSVGYGAIVEDNGKKITPFGPDEESINAALPKFRDDHTKAAQAKGDTYYTAYAHAYNEGMEQGVKLKKEADAAARNQQLADEKKTIEYKVGGILGTACGAAAAKRESTIDVSYEIPKKDAEPEKVVIQGPLNPVRSAVMGQKKTPDEKLEGDALQRSFMQSYNMAQDAHSKQKKKGPERDADYTDGYDRGYQLGTQIAEGTEQDPALLEEKKSYNTLPEDAPKPKQQNKNGFYAGYNRGQIDVENKKAKAKKDAIEERNNDPSFKSGFATGSMQGFLKALLDPSGTDLLTALQNPQVMKEGGIPEYFPIPDVIRANVIAVIQGGSGDKAINELINKPKFKEGQLIGFNQGYGNGEQNRMTFKQQQFRLHPDYQESQKTVYSEVDPISGEAVDMNMGHLEAHLTADYRGLQKQEKRSAEDEEKLKTYDKTLKALAAETAKQNEFYRRGVIDSYNSALPVEEKRVKDAAVKEAHNDPEYLEGFHWGEAVGESLFKAKEKVKELRRNGVDITARNQALNKKRQQVNKDAQKKGKKYFDGYARGYSDMLRKLENADKKTDMGNDLTNTKTAIRDANTDAYKLDPAAAKKAFEEGAKQGYNLYFENKKINVETGEKNPEKNYGKLRDTHNESKIKTYQKDDEAKKSKIPADQLIQFYQEGYNFIDNKSDYLESPKPYGAGKGLADANQFNNGFREAVEDAKNGEKKEPDGKDAYKAGYYAGEKYAKYTQFRANMVGAQRQMQNAQTNADGSHSTNVDHTDHAATENSVADTNALGVLGDQMAAKEAEKITHAANPVEMTKQQEGKLYEVRVAEHESQARDLAQNRQWLTKVIYLKEGIPLKGTELEDKTVSVELKDESGNPITKTISNKPEDVIVARDFYGNRARYIEQLAQAYVDKTIEEDNVLSSEGVRAKFVKFMFPQLLTVYEEKLQQIKDAYIKGYNELFDAILTQGKPDVLKAWYHDIGYIKGIKEQAGDNEEVKKLHLPTPPAEGLEIDENSDEYQNGYTDGLQMGQQIKSGLIDLSEDRDAFAKMQGGDYKRGFDEGKKIGVRTGEVAALDIHKNPPSEQDIKDNLAEERNEAGLEVDPEFERGYVEGFFVDYWKSRDYYYGFELGYERNRNEAEGSMKPEDGVTLKDNAAFIDGYNKGRSDVQMGRGKDAKSKDDEEETWADKIKKAAQDIAWHNGTIRAMTEINNASPGLRFLDKLPLVFAGHPLYGQFESLKSIQAITTELDGGSLGKDIANTFPYEIPEPVNIDSNEDLVTIDSVNSLLPSRDSTGMGGLELDTDSILCLEIIKDTYKLQEENTYQQALSDMMNLTMIMASDPNGGGPDSATTGGGSSSGSGANAGVVADLMEELDRLFGNGGSHQNFVIDELELIDRFYELESKIEGHHDPIKEKLEEIEIYQMTMEYIYDADTTLLASEIYQLELDIQALEGQIQQANAPEKKALRQEKRALENELKNKQREERLQGTEKDTLKRDWEQAEEDVKQEIDQIRLFMEDEIAFETPLASNEDILEYIKINLETSKRREEGEQVYEDIDIFNNLKLQGAFSYEEASAFDAYLRGDGTLQISADAERINVGDADVEIEREGFKFTAKGLEHDHNDNSFTLFDGHLITPKIEGGRHEGVTLDYTFHTFRLEKGLTIKAEIESQIDQLKGG